MARVVVLHQHTNNFGDAAAGAAAIRAIKDTLGASRVDVFYIWQKADYSPVVDDESVVHHFVPELSGLRDIRSALLRAVMLHLLGRPLPAWLARIVDATKAADFVFVSPAGSNIGIYKDWTYLLVLLAVVLNGVRPIFFQNTIGSSNSAVFNAFALYVLRRCDLNVRELASHEWLAARHLTSYLGVDAALLLGAPETTSLPLDRGRYLAVVPTRLSSWHRDFRGTDDMHRLSEVLVPSLAGAAVALECEILIVPHLYGAESESEFLGVLADRLTASGCVAAVVDPRDHDDYLQFLAGAEVVLSMRYHGLVLAALCGVPCVSLAYENKMREAARYLGVADLCRDPDTDSETLGELLQEAQRRRMSYRADMESVVPLLRTIARAPVLGALSRQLRSSRA